MTTAQQDVLIFSLPYLNSDRSVIKLEPIIICRLSDDIILHQDNFLLQTTRVCWHYQKGAVNVLVAGYVSGDVAIWNFEGKDDDTLRYPDLIFQAHRASITAIDMKPGENGQYFLLTASLAREIKLFSVKNGRAEEISVCQPPSRTLCAQLWTHWAGYLYGNDNAYALGMVTNRQPLDFAKKHTVLMNVASSIIDIDINHWTNNVLFTTDAGDVLGVTPHQLLNTDPKDRWRAFDSLILSFTDFKRIPQASGGPDEIGIVFNDMKVKIYSSKKIYI